ncbi:hypothetical protein ACROYT_G037191 [Oculina patagonica]
MNRYCLIFAILSSVFGMSLCEEQTTFTSKKDLGNLCQDIWNSAGNNLKIGKEIIIYTGTKSKPLITLTRQGKAKVRREVFVRFKALLDNYEADENIPEKPSASEQLEEDAFINAITVDGGPIQIAFNYLKRKGKVSGCLDQFKPILKKMWFEKYAKWGRHPKSSGFEHTFVGELGYSKYSKSKVTKGFHNWLQFFSERTAGRLAYFPPPVMKDAFREPAYIRAKFQWKGNKKPPGSSFFVGTSPDFEMALYTACFFEASKCTYKINGKRLSITSINFRNKGNVLTAYPSM